MSYVNDPDLVVTPLYYSGGVPVFAPTMKQFEDFYKFNKAINKYGMELGIVKVIPPREWGALLPRAYTRKNLLRANIKNPIVQQISITGAGVYSIQNIEKQKKYNIFQWKELSERSNYQPPTHRRRSSPDKSEKEAEKPIANNSINSSSDSNSNLVSDLIPNSTPNSTPSSNANYSTNFNTSTNDVNDSPSKRLRHHHHYDPLYNIDSSQFTPERCEELEKTYWRTLTYAEPMYGADMLGSIFPSNFKSWNVDHLPNILDLMDTRLPGVNDAYLYAGLWKATFAWHLEDQDLYSINYLHFGSPKQWYLIPQAELGRFFSLMKETFTDDYNHCHEFLRHKTFLVSPSFLDKHGIKYNKIVHNEGEFMITYPFGYHAGFNYGYNLAESVNFALDDWFPYGEVTKKCECISDSVGINVKQLYCKFQGIPYKSELDGIDTEATETEAETSQEPDDINIKIETIDTIMAIHSKKRKNSENSKETTRKKHRKVSPAENTASITPKETKQTKQTIKNANFECYLCPNIFNSAQISLNPLFELVSTDLHDSKTHQYYKVHRICAGMFPKELKTSTNSAGDEIVLGLTNISKNQMKLKCKVCNKGASKKEAAVHGACFQCSYPKCTRGFHGTCGVSDGVIYSLENHKPLCKYHRSKKVSSDRYDKLSKISGDNGSWVQFSFNTNQYFGLVLTNNLDEHTLTLLVYPNLNDRIEVPYDFVLTGATLNQLDNLAFINPVRSTYLTKAVPANVQ